MSKKRISVVSIVAVLLFSAAIARGEEAEKNAKLTFLTGGTACTISLDGEELGESVTDTLVTPGDHTVVAESTSGEKERLEKTVTAVAGVNTVVRFDFEQEPVPAPVAAPEEEKGKSKKGLIILGGVGVAAVGGGVAIAASGGGGGDDDGETDPPIAGSDNENALILKSNLAAPDGDKVDVYVNGVLVLDDFELTPDEKKIEVDLKSGMNYVVIEAVNEGTAPPNTGVFTITTITGIKSDFNWFLNQGERVNHLITLP